MRIGYGIAWIMIAVAAGFATALWIVTDYQSRPEPRPVVHETRQTGLLDELPELNASGITIWESFGNHTRAMVSAPDLQTDKLQGTVRLTNGVLDFMDKEHPFRLSGGMLEIDSEKQTALITDGIHGICPRKGLTFTGGSAEIFGSDEDGARGGTLTAEGGVSLILAGLDFKAPKLQTDLQLGEIAFPEGLTITLKTSDSSAPSEEQAPVEP